MVYYCTEMRGLIFMANSAKQIRNSTAEFLIFASQSESDTVEVRLKDTRCG